MQDGGIYIHIPFCQKKCGYCDFYSVTRLDDRPAFLKALLREIEMTASLYSDFRFDSIYVGGGTPSLLSPRFFEKIWAALHRQFTIRQEGEFTIEVNPGTINRQQLTHLRQMGFNRLSLGAQSFHDSDLKFLGRIHTVREIPEGVDAARQAGFKNLNLDLMTAFPGLTPARFRESLQQAAALNCEHISCYTLIFEPHTPFHNRLKKGMLTELAADQQAEFYDLANSLLGEKGYTAYEISNFARHPEFYCRHNLKYWQHHPYLGFGPAAHSFISPRRWRNVRTLPAYINRLKKSLSPLAVKEKLTDEELEFEYIFLHLRLREGLNLQNYQQIFRKNFLERYQTTVNRLQESGMVVKMEDGLKLSPRGWLLADEVASLF